MRITRYSWRFLPTTQCECVGQPAVLLCSFSRNTALMVWMVMLITRRSTTQLCKCGFRASALEPRCHGLDGDADHAWINDTVLHVWVSCIRIGVPGVIVWMLVLITRGSTTQACTCVSCASAWEETRTSQCRRPTRDLHQNPNDERCTPGKMPPGAISDM